MPSGGYFCCPTGYVGVLPVSGYTGICEDNIDGLAQSRIASPATQGTTSRPAGPATSNTAAAPATGTGAGLTPSQQTKTTNGGITPSNSQGSDNPDGPQSSPSSVLVDGGSIGSSSIPTGAVAGIVIGGALLLLLGAALLLWLHRRSLRRHRQSLTKPREPCSSAAAIGPVVTQAQQQFINSTSIPHSPVPPPAYSHVPAVVQAAPPSPVRACQDGPVLEGQVEVGGTPRAEMPTGRV